ncbi:MAG: GNAT family N-acetyltransferase [Microbacterium sp.]|nr:MAG: GNAT family N-acetyltransferase [Microbacterium sp.]
MNDLNQTFLDADVDGSLVAALASQQLEVHRVDSADRTATDPWLDAVARGFLDEERSDTHREAFFDRTAYRRKLGVYDPRGPQPEVPVATFASWGAELTLPGGAVPSCAISSVTVAPTHRRRGLLRHLMVGELQAAVDAGFPLAMLTASEASIYGRFGFGPAAAAAEWSIDVRRAGWRVAEPHDAEAPGRIDFVSREQGRARAEDLHDRVRVTSPGEIDMPGGHWDRAFGTRPDAEKAGELRVAQYRSADGEVDGLVGYRISHNHDDFSDNTLRVAFLLSATDAAYAALWRFLLSMDLIGTITASELSVDEPLWWMIADQRAVTMKVGDHQYLRILDVAGTLEARRYDVVDTVVLDVDDPLGFASGRFRLATAADGSAQVSPVADDADTGEAPVTRLGVAELSAILLGGVSPATLDAAGRLQADDPDRLTRLFATTRTPRLSFWY